MRKKLFQQNASDIPWKYAIFTKSPCRGRFASQGSCTTGNVRNSSKEACIRGMCSAVIFHSVPERKTNTIFFNPPKKLFQAAQLNTENLQRINSGMFQLSN